MKARIARLAAGAGIGATLVLGSVLTGSASVAAEPAPSCVTYSQSWRYTDVTNGCGTTLQLKVVYKDGAEGVCHTVHPSPYPTTIGSGYIGEHGYVDHIAWC
ncbi:hypothetical protein [Actinomadura kijaniata]|uniref:hypothetical protein n=1 Tax=Actinomadura kijaniata TaxID=46161 RepID=UPI0008361F06|nr:hypothetical protein [Actinomadura kijaniata]